ncbi:phosphotransferase [Lederbergia citri]|uniref:Phosphotransferase n=1 Tax=Lederbergia citri TaxID=2833580 RepID=A0A942TE61_9BACI|nr:phosphotransferase [Lederbergia citri]MBS4195163.1 phosphotransferase [Lederbergia citri]
MREPKPYWREVPQELREQIVEIVGSPIRRATRVFGGYGPSATFRIFLEDGKTIFAKGAGKGSISGNWDAIPNEEFVYQNINAIQSISPSYFGSVSVDGWHLLLLEDLGGTKKVPPWSEKLGMQAVRDIASFHLRGISEGTKVEILDGDGIADNWNTIKNNHDEWNCFLELFQEDRVEAESWLDSVIDVLMMAEKELLLRDQPWGLIHTDIRSDNLRFRNGNLVLFDWALVRRGPLMFDVGFFFPSVEGEGGPLAESLLSEYLKVMKDGGISFPSYSAKCVAASTAGFFASRAGKPVIPPLPRLRQVQRLQLGPALRWACSVLELPTPPKLNFNL